MSKGFFKIVRSVVKGWNCLKSNQLCEKKSLRLAKLLTAALGSWYKFSHPSRRS